MWEPTADMPPAKQSVELCQAYDLAFRTDSGRLVRAYLPVQPDEFNVAAKIDRFVTSRYVDNLEPCDGPGLAYNCHGWVFTAGQFWVKPTDIDWILNDNGYQQVTGPRPGDLVVYRDERGMIEHSGVVQKVKQGRVMVESKWGIGGRYLHPVEMQVYSEFFTYHRSPRCGHQLQCVSLPGTDPADPPAVH